MDAWRAAKATDPHHRQMANDLLLAIANVAMLLTLLAYYWTPTVFYYAALGAAPIALLIIIRLTRGN
jgi:hypothetical protein